MSWAIGRKGDHFQMNRVLAILVVVLAGSIPASGVLSAATASDSPRIETCLAGPDWQFVGAADADVPPSVDSAAYGTLAWMPVTVPHNFQTRAAFDTLTKGWYRRTVHIEPSLAGKRLYLRFEGAATVADVYVNGEHLGQHRGAYTGFVFDATSALHVGADNSLAVFVDNSPVSTADCLPSGTRLYKVWGGLYRKVWLVAASPVHIDPTDYGSSGVYLTPANVSSAEANLKVRVLLRNASSDEISAEVRARILDPDGNLISTLSAPSPMAADSRSSVEASTSIANPRLWAPFQGELYRVQVGLYVNGKLSDEVTEFTGFRQMEWDWKHGSVRINGKPVVLIGANLHQETESKGSAVSDDDLRRNFDFIDDLGMNFIRFCHYPHAKLEYDLCDQKGILCWAENGHSNSDDQVGATAARITTEMVKQNYNHPSIVLWSVGNEASAAVADQCVPIVKNLDPSRSVVVANMPSTLADIQTRNEYPGWYKGEMANFRASGFISEVGAGGLVSTHCDYDQCNWRVNSYEPEEYQQLVAEYDFQQVFHSTGNSLGLFCWWILRDFTDNKYKKPIGINSKGLLTYAGDKKDIYYLFRSFSRPDTPTLWITSKRYFVRQGAADNGIKVYSNSKRLTLTLNGEVVSTINNGLYSIPAGPWVNHFQKAGSASSDPKVSFLPTGVSMKVENVFYWPVSLRQGKNVVTVTDDGGNKDSAVVEFAGADGRPEQPEKERLLRDLESSNAKNPAFLADQAVQDQWPFYTDFDSSADNSWDRVPADLKGASLIALHRVSKPENATTVTFTLSCPANVYVVTGKDSVAGTVLSESRFEVHGPAFVWRDNALQLVQAQAWVRTGSAGEVFQIPLGPSDAAILIKRLN